MMIKDVLFSERQHFKLVPIWLILIGFNALLGYAFVKQIIYGEKFGQHPMTNFELTFSVILVIFITIIFILIRLDTIIDKDAIYVRIYPFQIKFKRYCWNNINEIFVTKYKPILGYGGWGFRLSITGKKAINISGNEGIQIIFNNGKHLLIGTNKPFEVQRILDGVFKNN